MKILTKMTTIRTFLKILTISILVLVLAACAMKAWQPVPGDYYLEEGFIVIRTDSLLIALRPANYRGSRSNLNSDFFSIYVQLKNTSVKKLQIPASSFAILSEGRQYDHIPISYILDNARDQIYFEQWQDPFHEQTSVVDERQKLRDEYYELLANSFNFGELLPSATKQGYLFYPRAAGRSDSLAIDALGKWVRFTRRP